MTQDGESEPLQLRFTHENGLSHMVGGVVHAFDVAFPNRRWSIGNLLWFRPGYGKRCNGHEVDLSYQVMNVSVANGYRRRGVATALLAEARLYAPVAMAINRTLAGDSWARSTGEELPECPCRCTIQRLESLRSNRQHYDGKRH